MAVERARTVAHHLPLVIVLRFAQSAFCAPKSGVIDVAMDLLVT